MKKTRKEKKTGAECTAAFPSGESVRYSDKHGEQRVNKLPPTDTS